MKWREEVWERTGPGYKKLGKSEGSRRYGSTGFVASEGTCQGDSGGPAFVKDGSNFVVTGSSFQTFKNFYITKIV